MIVATSLIVAASIALVIEIFLLYLSAKLAYMGGTITMIRSVMQWGLVFALRAVVFVIVILIAGLFTKGAA